MTNRFASTIWSVLHTRTLLLAIAALPSLLGAQAPWSLRVQADNDAFNFWQQPGQRPDAEYSNGVRISFSSARAPWWGARLAPRLAPCTGGEERQQHCLSTTFSIGQDIYTPKRLPYSYAGWQDERPYAGWLYGSMMARIGSGVSHHSAELQLGLTGPGSLGEFAQKTAHRIASYEAVTTGWETQIGTEAGVLLAYRYSRRIIDLSSRGSRVFDVIPQLGASLGNVLTAAEGGVRARVGMHLSDPWQAPVRDARKPYELYAFAGARRQLVAHSIFLDGNTFGPTRRVDRVPTVDAWEFGIGARMGRLTMAYQAATRTREYRTGPRSHTYGSLIAGIGM